MAPAAEPGRACTGKSFCKDRKQDSRRTSDRGRVCKIHERSRSKPLSSCNAPEVLIYSYMTENAVIGNSDPTITENATETNLSNYSCSDGDGIYNATDGTLTLGTAEAPLTGGIYYNYSDSKGGGIFNDAVQSNIVANSCYILRNGAARPSFSGLGGTAITISDVLQGKFRIRNFLQYIFRLTHNPKQSLIQQWLLVF